MPLYSKRIYISSTVFALGAILLAAPATASVPSGANRYVFAQKLVEHTLSRHPEITGLELSTQSPGGCATIASNDPKDLAEKCDWDELSPLKTGQPYIEKESDGFDATLALHDASGAIIGVVGMDFKPHPGQSRAEIVAAAKKIVGEMEARKLTQNGLLGAS